jgi:hypothetical protein
MLDVVPELENEYGEALDREGGRPSRWPGVPRVEERTEGPRLERKVDADSLIDACAASVRTELRTVRPWSTRHCVIGASFDDFANAVRCLFRTGFQCGCTTISHCSQTQWSVEFHGANTGLTSAADVRLETTSADPGRERVTFVLTPLPAK